MFCCDVVPLRLSVICSRQPFRSISHIHDSLQQNNSLSKLTPIQYYNAAGAQISQLEYSRTSQAIKLVYNQVLRSITIESQNKAFSCWVVLKPNQNWPIQKNCQFRLSQIPMQIYDIYNCNQLHYEFQNQELKYIIKGSCRFCYGEQDSKADPLLTFCKCAGTVKYTHLNCLKEWVHSKSQVLPRDRICFIRLFNIKCDLCKEDLPFEIQRANKKYTIFNYKKQFKPELQLSQSQSKTNQSHYRKANSKFFVIKSQKRNDRSEKMIELVIANILDEQSIFLGSNFMNGIMLRDTNVSDYHAYITNKDSKLWFTDFNSDLGSFFRIKNNEAINFQSETGIAIQYVSNSERYQQQSGLLKEKKIIILMKSLKKWTNMFASYGTYTINFTNK